MSHAGGRPPSAVALAYDGVAAPRVTARAEGELQHDMLMLARAHGVPIHRDAGLAQLLSQVRLDDEIPLPLFVAVAEILAFAYRLRGATPPGRPVKPAPQATEPEAG